jgi:hypothetical protein
MPDLRLSSLGLSSLAVKFLLRFLAGLVILYLACGAFIWWSMRQPPEKFGRVMARIPGPVAFMLFPFETLWTQARAGTLNVGDPAPDFLLQAQDKSGTIQLSALNRQRPVVLVFGSYT